MLHTLPHGLVVEESRGITSEQRCVGQVLIEG